MSVSFDQNCLHFTSLTTINSECFSNKYEKLPYIITNACKNITEKWLASKFCFLWFDAYVETVKS